MENASKALLIAGGIFLALLTITLLFYMFSNLNTIGEAQTAKIEKRRLDEWNAEWEAYNKQLLQAADVLTVYNKAEQNNLDYNGNTDYYVTVHVLDKDGRTNIDIRTKEKAKIFKCVEMKYSQKTGRINDITFQFVE